MPVMHAQSIKLDLDHKVIHTDSLNLPYQTKVTTVLAMIPELLQRPSSMDFSNYDIKVDDVSVGDVSDVALSQLDLQDVKMIEIEESPTASYQNNGQGGSINLVLRRKEDKGHWGGASAVLAYPSNIMPEVRYAYQSKRLYLSALMLCDIYDNTNTRQTLKFLDNKIQNISNSTFSDKYRTQMANVLMEYKLSTKDVLKFNVIESHTYDKNTTIPNYDAASAMLSRTTHTTLNTIANYKRKTKLSTFEFETKYQYNPTLEKHQYPSEMDMNRDITKQSVAGKVKYTASVLNPASPELLKLTVGTNYQFVFGEEEVDYRDLRVSSAPWVKQSPDNNVDFVQPYASVEAAFGQFRMKVQGEYQHYSYRMQLGSDPQYKCRSNDITGQAIIEWHFTPNRTVRLFGARALQRPTEAQLLPKSRFSPLEHKYVKGNVDLTPEMTHEIRIDYITDERWDDHQLHFDANVSYKHVSDIIESVIVGGGSSGTGVGLTQRYTTYHNSGKNDILSANLMAMYTYKSVAVTLSGNVFHNRQQISSGTDHYNYFNLSLCPHFKLKDGWQGSFGIIYNSKVATEGNTLGNCTQTSTIIGKRWNNLYIYCYSNQALQKHAKNTTWDKNIRQEYLYEMIPNSAGIGFKYLF